MPSKVSMIADQRFGRLTILSEDPERTRSGNIRWLCRCDCGTVKSIDGDLLRAGRTTSCGCYVSELTAARNTRHGQSKSLTYTSWTGMHDRCKRPTSSIYRYYGGRGITVDPVWDSFEKFLADMGHRPSAEYSIERVDHNGPYSPENCRWATVTEQRRNTRRSRFLTHNGMTLTLAEWAERVGIGYMTLRQRLRMGWPLTRALTERVDPLGGRFIAKNSTN